MKIRNKLPERSICAVLIAVTAASLMALAHLYHRNDMLTEELKKLESITWRAEYDLDNETQRNYELRSELIDYFDLYADARKTVAERDREIERYKSEAQYREDQAAHRTIREQYIADSLHSRPDLITFVGDLGGTPHFFEQRTQVITEAYYRGSDSWHGLVSTCISDGHWEATLLFYYIMEEENITWRHLAVIAGGNLSVYADDGTLITAVDAEDMSG